MEQLSNQFARPMKYSFSQSIAHKTLVLGHQIIKKKFGSQILQGLAGINKEFGPLALMDQISTQ